jgi:hypothetical protein
VRRSDATNLLRRIVRPLLPGVKRASVPAPGARRWGIGIYAGASPWQLVPVAGARNPVLTSAHVHDVPASLVADPFMLRSEGRWYMFFEVFSRRAHRGQIGLATSKDGLRWRYARIVLAEPFHLSYPYVFEWAGERYMIPETGAAGAVRLYRARRFPDEWQFVGSLLQGEGLVDASIFRVHDAWWMFVETSHPPRHDTLRLFGADRLEGPWREHRCSPIVAGDPRLARPAGRVVVANGRIVRFAQDCERDYGMAVRAFEVEELGVDRYAERPLGPEPVLTGSGVGWNAGGMHHVDAHRRPAGDWIACVDGWAITAVATG